MIPDSNQAGMTFTANVSVSEALVLDTSQNTSTSPNDWLRLSANDFDLQKHGKCEFFCPCCWDQKKELVKLKRPSGAYFQAITFDLIDSKTGESIIDPQTLQPKTETRRYLIPPRFSLWSQSKHACDLGSRQNTLIQNIKENGGITLNSASGAYLINLDIPAGQTARAPSKRFRLSESGTFEQSASPGHVTRKIHRSYTDSAHSTPRSYGAKTVEKLAELLDGTEFDKGQRKHIILRIGEQAKNLDDTYFENPLDMYRHLYKKAREIRNTPEANPNNIALFFFKPSGAQDDWRLQRDGSVTVCGLAEQTQKDGHTLFVRTKVNFQKEEAFQSFKKKFETGERNFLIYTEHANVSLQDYAKAMSKMTANQTKSTTLSINTSVYETAQTMAWQPQIPQLSLNFPTASNQEEKDNHPETITPR